VPHLGPVLGEWACHHGLVSLAKDSEHTRQLYWELRGVELRRFVRLPPIHSFYSNVPELVPSAESLCLVDY
jgi:hypothetical protein